MPMQAHNDALPLAQGRAGGRQRRRTAVRSGQNRRDVPEFDKPEIGRDASFAERFAIGDFDDQGGEAIIVLRDPFHDCIYGAAVGRPHLCGFQLQQHPHPASRQR